MSFDEAYQITPAHGAQAVAELSTIQDMLRWSMTQFEKAESFYGHGTDNPWDEALALVLPCLELPPHLDESYLTSRLIKEERETIVDAVCLRVNEGVPVAYITHQAYFCEMPFYVDERVIIPRSPIAELILQGFQPWLEEEPQAILDMCTGSGCIAIACAVQFEQAQVDAVDLSVEALEVAATNVEIYDLEERVHLIQSDLFESIPDKQYDLIVSNPPYVSDESMEYLPTEFLSEPDLALRAGNDGLSCAIPIIQQAAKYLKPEGVLILEVGESQEALEAAFPDLPKTWLSFERGGEGVCAIRAADLKKAFKI
jgi:ribosomal protein L3 glutamine methyltransferase